MEKGAATVQRPSPFDHPIPAGLEEAQRWLRVEKVREGSEGGWARAGFDRTRNKIVIDTHDVTGFSLDVRKIPLNWQRKVILSIDGVNSELRKRDIDVYHFIYDEHGRWRILEPPSQP